jgi:dihydrolipoamide dehydrogenase
VADKQFDLVVIGGGPAGYVGAIRAAQLGMSVACVERDRLGGVCLNWGCIPTKALLAGASFYHRLKHDAEDWGISAQKVSHNWEKVIGRSRGVAGNLNKGVAGLFKKNKITHFEAHAFIPEAGTVQLFKPDDPQHQGEPTDTLQAGKILIATGAQPRELPFAPFDGEKVIRSAEAMTLKTQPEKLAIIGAGAIGMEFAYFYNAFGTEVTVIEMLDRVLPIEDHEVSAAAAKAYQKLGVKLLPGHKTTGVEVTPDGVKLTVGPADDSSDAAGADKKSYSGQTPKEKQAKGNADSGGERIIEADKVLVAIGVKGRYDGLFDDKLGLELYKDHIKVDYKKEGTDYSTSVDGIYAVGDVIGPPWLAHLASEEAVLCVERMAGHDAHDIDYDSIPGCTYCEPQVASIGLTEQACKDQGLDYKVGKFPFLASGKAQAVGETTGFVKMIAGKKHGEILGCHMIGENVTELIAEIGLARKLEATADEVIATIHAHPTMSEATHEAALGTEGRMLHF